jgi:hypothetical protein
MKIVLLNGSPRAGKNTAAEVIAAEFGAVVLGFSHHLKRCVHAIHLGREGWLLDPDHFDAVKSEVLPEFCNKSPRTSYITFSEQYIKPVYGKEWFGEKWCEQARQYEGHMISVPDSGFREEAERVIREFGPQNVLLIRVHRPGRMFEGDSRSYICLSDLHVHGVDVRNDSDVGTFAGRICHEVRRWAGDH